MSARDAKAASAHEPERYELTGDPAYRFDLQRREWFKVVGAGLVIGVAVRPSAHAQESGRASHQDDLPEEIGAWIHVDERGAVSVFTGKAEIGQNIRTSLTQAVADELRVPASSITMVMADTARTPFDAGTFGSRTTPFMAPQLRRAAAAARSVIVDLAATRWAVDPSTIEAAEGRVRHVASGRTAAYGELTRGQRLTRVIGKTATTTREGWRLGGTSVSKTDGHAFVTGRHQFVSDVTRPGLLQGTVVRPNAFGATLASADTAGAAAVAGVRVVRDGDFIGVVAPDVSSARKAASLVRAEWRSPSHVQDSILFEHLRRTADASGSAPVHASGSVEDGRRLAVRTLEATYTIAYIAHVPLEPRAAVAEWDDSGLTVWTASQRPFGVRRELADAFRLPLDRVRVIVPDSGGAYGGKHTGETAVEAARLAKAAGRPVRVTWTREEEFTWAYFRPAGVIDMQSGLDAAGRMAFWAHDNINSGAAAIRTPYDVPHQRIRFIEAQSPLRQGSYRGLAATANNFARESHIDELAQLAGVDPVDFRLRHLADARLKGVLQVAAERAGWGKPASGAQLGIACGFEKMSYVGTAVALAVENGQIRLERIVCAFDCGTVVNPGGVRNQIEGALVQGIGGALFEAVRFADGRVTNDRLSQYRVPRFADVPAIEVVSVEPQGAAPVGAGETPLIALAPAIAGAVVRATGKRVRSLPIEPVLGAPPHA
jgi:nicotinate dehydrogenase subunit B